MKKIGLILFILLTSLYSTLVPHTKVVNVALGIDKPPFIYGKTSHKGIEADIIKEAFHLIGYKTHIIQKPKSYLQSVLHHDNDIDAVATITQQNDELFYSDTLTSYNNYVITRTQDHIKIRTIDDLQTIKFVTWEEAYNDLGDEFYKLFNPIDGTAKSSYNTNASQKDDVEMFFSGKVDAIIIDKTIFNWFKIHFNNREHYTFHKIFKGSKNYPVAFRDEKLRDKFNIALRRLKNSGRYDEIIKFYETQNVEELLTFTSLLSNIASKYILEGKPKKLNKILQHFFSHPDIVAISIENKLNDSVFIQVIQPNGTIKKMPTCDCGEFDSISHKIYYKKYDEITQLGTIYIYYKKDYKTIHGILIPSLSELSNLDKTDQEYIKKMYKKLNLLDQDSVSLTKNEQRYLNDKQFITVHNESTWAPYNFNINGIPRGFVIDYVDLLAKKLHIKVKYISNHTWSEFLELIKTEQIDVISNIAKTKEREEYLNFTQPFIQSKKAIFSNIPNLNQLSDLNGKTVAIPYKFYMNDYLKQHFPKIKIKNYKNVKECLYAVVNKEADALVENYSVVNYLIKENGLFIKYVTIKGDKNLITNLRLGIRKSQPILADILQKAQNSVTQDEFDKLEDKWFGLSNISTQSFTQKQQEYVRKKKTIKVCTNPNWAPIEFREDGQAKGVTIDVIKLIAKKAGLKLDFIKTNSWKESQEFLQSKKCDILSSAMKTNQRTKYANFTDTYLSYDLLIVTKNDKPIVNTLPSIVDKPMARKEASGVTMILKYAYPNLKVIDTPNMYEAFRAVQNDKAYFTVATLPVYGYNKKRGDFNELQVVGSSNLKCDLRIAVRDDDKMLLSVLNRAIELISSDTIQVLNDKWTTQDVIQKTNYTIVWAILIVAIIIIMIIMISYKEQQKLKDEIYLLNISLEQKVIDEIQKNRDKDKLMLHQSRLAQMGEIISMIAHQWRQPLNSLSLLIQSIVLKYNMGKLDDEIMYYFKDNAQKQISNMSQTIDDFRNFFKPEKDQVNFKLNLTIQDTVNMLKPIIVNNKINIVTHLKSEVEVVGYPNEFGQAILNIINNAKDALIDNNIEKKKIEISLDVDNQNHAIVTIKDNAGGIPQDVINNIFDPYFSTKEEKNGTGLGLYMSKLIIEEHMNGSLSVKNEGDGASFIIVL